MTVTTTSVAVKDGNGVTQTLATITDPANLQRSVISTDDAGSAFYRASATFTPLVTSAVTLLQIKGSATKTVRIKRVQVTGVSTANASVVLQLLRTTTTGTGGTAVTPTIGKNDSGTVAAATAVVTHFTTAAQTSGTASGGPLSTFRFYSSVVTTPTVQPAVSTVFPEAGAPVGQAIVLRGAADFVELQLVGGGNLSAATVLDYTVEWTEDAS